MILNRAVADLAGHNTYRLDVEGLRAIAVLCVIAFHLGFPLSGGYVGVDVFFVVSGFLITRNILRDQQSGTFSFKTFYLRRFFRLFPALCTTVLFTLIAGCFLLAPDDLDQLCRTAAFAILSLSNIEFWYATGYFDPAATMNPLLHTWSLSVEEQFYLVWPALLFVATRLNSMRGAMTLVVAMGLASALGAALFRPFSSDAFFYLMPLRMYELCAGGILPFIARDNQSPRRSEAGALLGISAIAYSAYSFDSSTLSSHFAMFLPCIGTALLIYFGADARVSKKLLSHPMITAVGTISYSLYLVHWPAIVFYKYIFGPNIPRQDQWLLLLLCFALAIALYKCVEQPFRRSKQQGISKTTRRAFVPFAVAVATALGTIAHARLTHAEKSPTYKDLPAIPSATAMWEERNPYARVGSCFIFSKTRTDIDQDACLKIDPTKPNYLIIGDSIAADAYVYLSKAYPDVNFLQATAGDCRPLMEPKTDPICSSMLQMIFDTIIPNSKLDGVVFSGVWQMRDLEVLQSTIEKVRSQTPRIVLIGSGIVLRSSAPKIMFLSKYLTRSAIEKEVGTYILNGQVTSKLRQSFLSKVDGFIDVQGLMCTSYCRMFTPEDKPIYVDHAHMTLSGSLYLAPKVAMTYPDIFPTVQTSLEAGVKPPPP